MYLLVMAGVMVLLLAYSMGWTFNLPSFAPPIHGSNPPVTVTTDVKIVNPILSTPWIDSIHSTIGYANIQSQPILDVNTQWLSFKGKVELKVIAPDGSIHLVGVKRIMMDPFSVKTVTFVWKTEQRGKHIVIASLYDDQGNLLDQKKEVVVVTEGVVR